MPAFRLDPLAIAEGTVTPAAVVDWLAAQPADAAPLVYSSDAPEAVRAIQAKLGREVAGDLVERFLAAVAAAEFRLMAPLRSD